MGLSDILSKLNLDNDAVGITSASILENETITQLLSRLNISISVEQAYVLAILVAKDYFDEDLCSVAPNMAHERREIAETMHDTWQIRRERVLIEKRTQSALEDSRLAEQEKALKIYSGT